MNQLRVFLDGGMITPTNEEILSLREASDVGDTIVFRSSTARIIAVSIDRKIEWGEIGEYSFTECVTRIELQSVPEDN